MGKFKIWLENNTIKGLLDKIDEPNLRILADYLDVHGHENLANFLRLCLKLSLGEIEFYKQYEVLPELNRLNDLVKDELKDMHLSTKVFGQFHSEFLHINLVTPTGLKFYPMENLDERQLLGYIYHICLELLHHRRIRVNMPWALNKLVVKKTNDRIHGINEIIYLRIIEKIDNLIYNLEFAEEIQDELANLVANPELIEPNMSVFEDFDVLNNLLHKYIDLLHHQEGTENFILDNILGRLRNLLSYLKRYEKLRPINNLRHTIHDIEDGII